VGPEGDFTDEELQQLREAGALQVGLGGSRLRTETAAVALLALSALSEPGLLLKDLH
jgi:16S rRNA (uracil1498-N3)-methyltransferase